MLRTIAICVLLVADPCWAGVSVRGTANQATVYAHLYNGTTWLHVAMAQTASGSGVYTVADATIDNTLTVDCRTVAGLESGFPVVCNNSATDQTAVFLDGPREGVLDWDGSSERLPASQASVDELESTGAVIPVNQVAVPKARTWTLTRTANGLESELPIGAKISEAEQTFAIDFAKDLPTNGRLADFVSVEVYYEDEEDEPETPGLTFDDDLGVDKSQAKLKITPLTAGTYVLRVETQYGAQDGGGVAVALVELVVTP